MEPQDPMKKDPIEFFLNLAAFLADDEGMTPERIHQELLDEGLDPDEFVAKIRALIDRHRQIAKATKALEGMPTEPPYKEEHLVYAATSRCLCGAGLAYPRNTGPNGNWDCSSILLGTAIPSGQGGTVRHSDQFPFAFYEILSEDQPTARGETTRPKKG